MASTSRAVSLLILSLALYQLATGVSAEPSLTENIQETFKEITTLSNNLRIDTQKINLINAPLQGPKIAQGFAGIISKVSEANVALSGDSEANAKLSPLGDDDAKLVVKSLTIFVEVHQALLNVVIGKHGLLTLIPFFEPIRLSLVSLEQAVDSFAFVLIGLIPTQKPAAETQFGSLGVTITTAIQTYEMPLSVQLLESAVLHSAH